ncbi:Condensin-2 complex subunit D3 [Gracilariopsis chorda]|uniref:Condensin-2 complex subunit D3 n=1 Tax=Gracilariopsis chorda TaxID=448386 RepID=A0A2V3IDF4_9FLOR|nr:Condensin-2 complex subunit D3 [Gracilariopsis chorda]|eukprot:PXF40081.1 Condensin-2 complex subunit D3 [Gracilariopsis chorda]
MPHLRQTRIYPKSRPNAASSRLAFFAMPSSPSPDTSTTAVEHRLRELKADLSANSTDTPALSLQTAIKQSALSALHARPPSNALPAAHLYLTLISTAPLTYDELLFDASLHALTLPHEQKAQTTPLQTARLLLSLLQNRFIDLSDRTAVSLLLRTIAHFIRHANAQLLKLLLPLFQAILAHPHLNPVVISLTYNACIPLVSTRLPAPNRAVLTDIIVQLANVEHNILQHPQPDSESEPPSANLPCPLLRFLQTCCLRAPDRAETRATVATFIHNVATTSSHLSKTSLHTFFIKALTHSRASVRLLAIQNVQLFFSQNQQDACQLVSTLCLRVSDRVPTVRAAALLTLLSCLQSVCGRADAQLTQRVLRPVMEHVPFRMRDDKSRVRRNALELVGFVCEHLISPLSSIAQDLQTKATADASEQNGAVDVSITDRKSEHYILSFSHAMHLRCNDTSALVRQSAVKHLSQVVLKLSGTATRFSVLQEVLPLWMQAVLPLLNDTDSRCQQVCITNVNTIFLSGIGACSIPSQNRSQSLSHLFLQQIGEGRLQLVELCKKAVVSMARKNEFSTLQLGFLVDLARRKDLEEIDGGVRAGSWIVIEAIASSGNAGAKLVLRALGNQTLLDEIVSRHNATACVTAVSLVSLLKPESKKKLEKLLIPVLFPRMKTKRVWKHGSFIASSAQLLSALSPGLGDEILEQCEAFLSENEEGLEDDLIVALLHIIGSVCVSFRMRSAPPSSVVTFVEAMTSNVQTSSSLRALAITTLGKLCLSEGFADSCHQAKETEGKIVKPKRIGEALTRRLLSVFVHELDNATSSATRSNAVIVLCDLCRHYTAVVEPFVPRLAALLLDPSEFVRVQVITSLVDLLQQDYIKIRTGRLFYHIAKGLLDPCSTVRSTAEFALLRVIATKNASILAVSFVELIFVLNNCLEGGTYNSFAKGSPSRCTADLGLEDYSKRRIVYDTFLQGIRLEHRVRLCGRLRTDILSNVLDEKLDLSIPSVMSVVEDVLALLASEHLNPFSRARASDGGVDEFADDETEKVASSCSQQNEQLQTKKAALLKKVQECELRDAMVPSLLELRHMLEKRRSPMIKNIMDCLCVLLQPHRDSLSLIVGNPVMRAEIEHQIAKGVEKKRAAPSVKISSPGEDHARKKRSRLRETSSSSAQSQFTGECASGQASLLAV